jgi:hypothetical protein
MDIYDDLAEHALLQPSTSTHLPSSSPLKKSSSPLRPMSPSRRLQEIHIPPPAQPVFTTDSPSKNQNFYAMYDQAAPPPSHDFDSLAFATSVPIQDKENIFAPSYAAIPPTTFADMSYAPQPDYGYKAPMKRVFDQQQQQPLKPAVKKQKTNPPMALEEPITLPNPEEMPPVVDDEQKPPHSYAELIGMAILRAPNRRLTLAQIYKWISDNFKFYKSSEGGWQNSIRHNLSLNKNFVKQERPKDDPGKGNYWAIKPGEERPYLIGRTKPVMRRITTNPDGSQYMQGLPMPGGFPEARPGSAPAISNFTLIPSSSKKPESSMTIIDTIRTQDETDILSDGTIPASDPALQEDLKDDSAAMPPPPTFFRSSPPPQDIGSSPPMIHTRRNTPPPELRLPSSRSGGRKRKFAGMADSGYYSSIESSAARGASRILASEADVRGHRIKKGRAEAEIARMRSSSFDSPSKERLPLSHFGSSPTRKDENPLTPAVIFKRPQRPPPSLSPNTNLRNHRDLMRNLLSPVKQFSPMPDASNWSPAFHLDGGLNFTPAMSPSKSSKSLWRGLADSPGIFKATSSAFDVFIDMPEVDLSTRGSPERKHDRRPSLARAATSAGILADITGTSKGNNLKLPANDSPFSLSPFLNNMSAFRSPSKLGSPLKQVQKASPTEVPKLNWSSGENLKPIPALEATAASDVAELFGFELPSDGSEEGIDIFQDFGKIGQSAGPVADRANGSPVKRTMGPPPPRPSLARSNTSRW